MPRRESDLVSVHVRVWFGKHPIADYSDTDVVKAEAYACAMRRRFPSLVVTCNQPLPGGPEDVVVVIEQ